MPSATPELRERMGQLFGDEIDDAGPMEFLKKAGYRSTADWRWLPKPGVTDYADMTQDEYDCMVFLCQEWDQGGLAISRAEQR